MEIHCILEFSIEYNIQSIVYEIAQNIELLRLRLMM